MQSLNKQTLHSCKSLLSLQPMWKTTAWRIYLGLLFLSQFGRTNIAGLRLLRDRQLILQMCGKKSFFIGLFQLHLRSFAVRALLEFSCKLNTDCHTLRQRKINLEWTTFADTYLMTSSFPPCKCDATAFILCVPKNLQRRFFLSHLCTFVCDKALLILHIPFHNQSYQSIYLYVHNWRSMHTVAIKSNTHLFLICCILLTKMGVIDWCLMGAPCFLDKRNVLAIVVPPTGNMWMCYLLCSG